MGCMLKKTCAYDVNHVSYTRK